MSIDVHSGLSLPAPKLSQRWRWASQQAISFLMQQAVENPDVISLAAGLVDPQSLPVEEARSAVANLLADDTQARRALQYGTTAGSERLRAALLKNLARLEGVTPQDLGIDAQQLVLTTGSQQLLSLIGEVLFDPSDICLVAAPTYFVFLGVLHGLGARVRPIATDGDGMNMDALEAELERIEAAGELERVKLIYLVSYYENPSGVSLSEPRPRKAVEIARRWSRSHRIFILEDAAYRELHYDGPTLPSIWGFDTAHETVILAQTFSKSFAPGVRVGWGVLPHDLVGPVCDRKGNEDFGSAHLSQHLLATVMENGQYEPHVRQVCSAYRAKRDAMLAAADRYFADIDSVTWVQPHGGLYVWMSLPEWVETGFGSKLFQRAVQEGMMYVPGELCYGGGGADPQPRHQMRLSFGVQTAAGINEGMKRLSQAVRHIIAETPPRPTASMPL